MKISKSPDRNTFQKEKYLERKAAEGRDPKNDENVRAMVEYYNNWSVKATEKEADPAWAENNMEYDLRTTDWILKKVRTDEGYAQNLYAAMCNNEFQKNEFMPRLAGQTWSCSWRYAGGIVADMREEGDYIDWYCSGIRGTGYGDDEEQELKREEMTEELRKHLDAVGRYVGEGQVTHEIFEDLKRLGWHLVPEGSYDQDF